MTSHLLSVTIISTTQMKITIFCWCAIFHLFTH